jgi:hypothetical protein
VAVRQRQEHDVVALEGLGSGAQQLAVGQRDQVRVVVPHGRAGAVARRHGADVEYGVADQQPQQLAAGVPAASRHCCTHRCTPCLISQ